MNWAVTRRVVQLEAVLLAAAAIPTLFLIDPSARLPWLFMLLGDGLVLGIAIAVVAGLLTGRRPGV